MPPLPTPRYTPGVTAFDGELYAVGGRVNGVVVGTVESYSPKTGRWTKRAPLPRPRDNPVVCTGNGRLFAIGGAKYPGGYQRDVQIYDPRKNKWTQGSPLPKLQASFICGTHKGRLYLAGASDMSTSLVKRKLGNGAIAYVHPIEPYVYDIKRNKWSHWNPGPEMIYGGIRSSGDIIGGKIYLLTECSVQRENEIGTAGVSHCLQKFDLESGELSFSTFLLSPYRGWKSVVHGEKIYVVGGPDYVFPGQEFGANSVESFDTRNSRHAVEKPLQSPHNGHGVAVLDGVVYIVGGTVEGSPRREVEIYRPWDDVEPPDMSTAPTRATDFALIVGVEQYRGLPAAKYSRRDAESIKEFLSAKMGVPEKNMVILLNEMAGVADLAKFMDEWLPRNITAESRVYFYFSGLGTADPVDGSPYIMLWDGDMEFLHGTAYSMKALLEKLQALKAKETIAMMETCFSGDGARCVTPRGTRPLVIHNGAVVDPRLSVMFAASPGEAAGVDDNSGHGVFTAELIRRIPGRKGARQTGRFTLGNWMDAVKSGIALSAREKRKAQTPQLISSHEDMLLP